MVPDVYIWPGDLNNDFKVTVTDILPIGYFYDKRGQARSNPTIQWVSQLASFWAYDKTNQNSPAYEVFADANGDGLIDLSDEAAIGLNLNQYHYKTMPGYIPPVLSQTNNAGDPVLTAIFPDTLIPGASLPKTITIPVNIGDAGTPTNNLLGLAFNLSFNPRYVNASSIRLDFSNSIFGTLGTDYIEVTDSDFAHGNLNIGLTRFNTTPLNTYGNVVNLKLTVPANAPLGYFKLYAVPLSANDQNGNPENINSSVDSTHVMGIKQAIEPVHGIDADLQVSPNPFAHAVNINYSLATSSKVALAVYDVNGKEIARLCNETQIPGKYGYTFDATKYNAAPGVYFLRMNIDGNVVEKKIVRVE